MSLRALHLSLLIGPVVPVPAPPWLVQAIQSVEVSRGGDGMGGFQIVFNAEFGDPSVPTQLLTTLLCKPFTRVILTTLVGGMPAVLVDGLITQQQVAPSTGTAPATLTLTGLDISVAMNLHDRSTEHPVQSPEMIVEDLLTEYSLYGVIPMVIPTNMAVPPLPVDRIPIQNGTDYEYICHLASLFGYVFHITPGPLPGNNTAYWGPPVRLGVPQPALSVNMGGATNVASISFEYDALAPTTVSGMVDDFLTDLEVPIASAMAVPVGMALRLPQLASIPAILANLPYTRSTLLRQPELSTAQGINLAASIIAQSTDRVVTGTVELDTFRYGHIVSARGLIGVRGAGLAYDGLYYVDKVVHRIGPGRYTQQLTLTREGLGSTLAAVPA